MKPNIAASENNLILCYFFFQNGKIRQKYKVKFKFQNFVQINPHVVRNIVWSPPLQLCMHSTALLLNPS